ncbi:DeoR/GlpR transcriptional regulator [Martelella alba]|uniref:DeoR/GlpR transcriptional regulator n=1 Tax=Martelella alba TaxID=2590451 RepID=A0A506U6U5_9HYPH|nr:DeoR/GlpR family DNA-binding transcription regulator [Martelella alba]TPW28811.1 DeoR/GlpR transcriptional regulator [Martelella alba]
MPQRHAQILERLQSSSYVDTQDLCAFLGVSEATVRRDLADLEGRGLIQRTHGGAVGLNQITRDFSNAERLVQRSAEKARIAKAAADLVVEGDAVLIDAGTTTLHVARQLSGRKDLTFVTNGADIFSCLSAASVGKLYVVGGEYFEVNHSFAGPLAADAIRRFNVDKVFLSVGAINLDRGQLAISSPLMSEAQRAMIDIAQTVVVVADHSKFGRAALSVTASLDEVDYIITDEAARLRVGDVPDALKRKLIFA